MVRLTIALLTLGILAATGTTAKAQECWWVGCNPEADLCRLLCGSDDINSQWRAHYAGSYPRQWTPYRHAKHHHTKHSSG